MERLPEILLLKIFSFLTITELGKVAKVSLQWRRIAYDHALWKKVNLKRYPMMCEDTLCMLIRTRFSPFISVLNLGGCRVTHDVFIELSKRCRNLKYLIFGRGSKLRQPTTRRASYEFPSELEMLELRAVKGEFGFLRRLTRRLCNLKYLGIGNASSRGAMPHIFNKLQQLVMLDCTNCDTITDESVLKVAENCQLLESLCLNGCKHVYGRTFLSLLTSCPRLRTLLLRYTPLRDESLQLREWSQVPIEELDISACTNVTQIGLLSLLSRLRSLTYLNLSYCGVGRAVSDAVLIQMATQNTTAKLEMLDVRWSLHITPDALCALLRVCPVLRCLGVYQSTAITTSAMADILRALPKLETFEYGAYGRASLSDSMFIPNMIRHCPGLRSISLINFTTVDSFADGVLLDTLAENCTSLQRINLCEPDPSLIALLSLAPARTRSKVTQRWQCVLPPPAHTLDSVIAHISYSPPYLSWVHLLCTFYHLTVELFVSNAIHLNRRRKEIARTAFFSAVQKSAAVILISIYFCFVLWRKTRTQNSVLLLPRRVIYLLIGRGQGFTKTFCVAVWDGISFT